MAPRRATRERSSPELRIPLADRREAQALWLFTVVVWVALIPFPILAYVITKSVLAIVSVGAFALLASSVTYVMRIDHDKRRACELVLDPKGIRLERLGRERWRARWIEVEGWRGSDDDRRRGKIAILTRDGRTLQIPVDGGLQIDGRYDRVANSIGEFCDEINST